MQNITIAPVKVAERAAKRFNLDRPNEIHTLSDPDQVNLIRRPLWAGGEWGSKGQCLLDAQPLGASGMGVILPCSVLFVRILDKTARICLVVQQELRVVRCPPH